MIEEGGIPWDPGGDPENNNEVEGPPGPGTGQEPRNIPPLPVLLEAMINSEKTWKAMASFSEEVMSLKEAEEMSRELDPDADPIRRKRRGQRRRNFLSAPCYEPHH